jgi:hypothetical protein
VRFIEDMRLGSRSTGQLQLLQQRFSHALQHAEQRQLLPRTARSSRRRQQRREIGGAEDTAQESEELR